MASYYYLICGCRCRCKCRCNIGSNWLALSPLLVISTLLVPVNNGEAISAAVQVSDEPDQLPIAEEHRLEMMAGMAVDAIQAGAAIGHKKMKKISHLVMDKVKQRVTEKIHEKLQELPGKIASKLHDKSSEGQLFFDYLPGMGPNEAASKHYKTQIIQQQQQQAQEQDAQQHYRYVPKTGYKTKTALLSKGQLQPIQIHRQQQQHQQTSNVDESSEFGTIIEDDDGFPEAPTQGERPTTSEASHSAQQSSPPQGATNSPRPQLQHQHQHQAAPSGSGSGSGSGSAGTSSGISGSNNNNNYHGPGNLASIPPEVARIIESAGNSNDKISSNIELDESSPDDERPPELEGATRRRWTVARAGSWPALIWGPPTH